MLAAEKLLNESRLSIDKYKSDGDVLAAGLSDRQEMVNLL